MPDLTVRGAGIFGLSVAWACVRRGARVRVIEARAIGAGSSGGIVGALAPHVPEHWNEKKAFQLESLLMAQGWWAGVEAASGLRSGYARTGRLQALPDLRAVEAARLRAAEASRLWQGQAEWQVVPAEGAWVPVSASGWMIRDTLTARLHPRHACAALAAALRDQGAEILLGDGDEFGPVVWATGHLGLRDLTHALGKELGGGVKGQALALRHGAADLPQLFADGLHIVPHADGTVAIGSTSERSWADDSLCDTLGDALLARALAICPLLAGAPVVERWAGVRPRAKSRAPMLGRWPGRADHFIANGGFKIGFGMAPKVAEVMADLVLDGRDSIPDGFRVEASF